MSLSLEGKRGEPPFLHFYPARPQCGVYLLLTAAFAFSNAGTTPSCCISPSASHITQLSAILPREMRLMTTPSTLIFLLVGAIPRNSPLCVPVEVYRVVTKSSASIMWSILNLRSGNALRYKVTICFSPAGPLPVSGVAGSWLTWLGAMISSATARFPLFSKSLKSFRTTCLFSEDIFALLWAGRLYHSQAAVGRLLGLDTMETQAGAE